MVVGATNWDDADADPNPTCNQYMSDGTLLDEIHVRSSWRDFSM